VGEHQPPDQLSQPHLPGGKIKGREEAGLQRAVEVRGWDWFKLLEWSPDEQAHTELFKVECLAVNVTAGMTAGDVSPQFLPHHVLVEDLVFPRVLRVIVILDLLWPNGFRRLAGQLPKDGLSHSDRIDGRWCLGGKRVRQVGPVLDPQARSRASEANQPPVMAVKRVELAVWRERSELIDESRNVALAMGGRLASELCAEPFATSLGEPTDVGRVEALSPSALVRVRFKIEALTDFQDNAPFGQPFGESTTELKVVAPIRQMKE